MKETKKVATTTIGGGAQYAKVADRLKLFREENPNGLIETEPKFLEDGSLMFRARILKDKRDQTSAESIAHAHSKEEKLNKEKGFEKLESIAVGRALANLGYLASGEIASSEEMEEFEAHKRLQWQAQIDEAKELLSSCKTLEELKEAFLSLDPRIMKELEEFKNELKEKLANPTE